MFNQFSFNNTLVIIGDNAVFEINNFLQKKIINQIFILVDINAKKYCLPHILTHNPMLKSSEIIELPSGESAKSIAVFEKICLELISKNINRNSLIINIGGGAVLDCGGFISGVLKRGLRFINIPTTLMAQIDASIGGKVGLNINDYKNQIGLFLNPELILIDPSYLYSLSNYDFLSAQAEVFKYALIYSKSFWDEIINIEFDKKIDLKAIITRCVQIKIEIIESDYYDFNERRKLNFGHSISHAIESLFFEKKHALSHGHALSVGLICESYISHKKYHFDQEQLDGVMQKILSVFDPIELDAKYDALILKYIKADKKNSKGIYNFTLIKEIGKSIVNCSVSDQEIVSSLDFYRKNAQPNTK